MRNAKCDFKFSTLPREAVQAVQYSCRNVFLFAVLTECVRLVEGERHINGRRARKGGDLLSVERLFYVSFLEADNVPWPTIIVDTEDSGKCEDENCDAKMI